MPWLDGTLHEGNVVPFDVADRGLLLGDGVFDTSLVLGGRMVWRQAHIDRLVASALVLGFAVEPARIEAAIDAVLVGVREGALRITCTRGPGPRGLAPPADPRPTLLASVAPLAATTMFAPMTLQVTAIRRNETSPASRLKSLGYLDAVLACGAARKAGYDDALFLDTRGHIACTSIGNVFALAGDTLVTPPLGDGVVAGTMRGILLRGCGAIGLKALEASLTLDDLLRADCVFVTNSLRLVAPVKSVGERTFEIARVRSIAAHVAKLLEEETGVRSSA